MQRYGMTIPFDGAPLHAQRDWIVELADLGYTDVWSSEANGADAFTPLALTSVWAPSLRLGKVDRHHPVGEIWRRLTVYLMTKKHAAAELIEKLRDIESMIERGVPVAIGTDFNPGTSPTPNLQLVLSLACLNLRLSPVEALVAATANSAQAVGLGATHGTLEVGRQADVVAWRVPSVDQLPTWLGADLVRSVVKRGRVVAGAGADPGADRT